MPLCMIQGFPLLSDPSPSNFETKRSADTLLKQEQCPLELCRNPMSKQASTSRDSSATELCSPTSQVPSLGLQTKHNANQVKYSLSAIAKQKATASSQRFAGLQLSGLDCHPSSSPNHMPNNQMPCLVLVSIICHCQFTQLLSGSPSC